METKTLIVNGIPRRLLVNPDEMLADVLRAQLHLTSVKVGCGKANFPELLKGLKAHGYDGSLTIEREITGEQQIVDIMETQKYLNELIEKL